MDVGVSLPFGSGRARGMDALVTLARHAEDVGLASFWLPEHVVFVEGATSQYPYGELALGRRPGVFDPIVGLAVAATVTSRLRLGTGVLILPLREPVTLAQQLVALDHAADGRLDLGIGVGWLREEFAALGVPWEGRGRRADEYVAALRTLWRDEVADHDGPTVAFRGLQAWPKPVQQHGVPVWVGGNTSAAVRRAARIGDGWFGWALEPPEVGAAVAELRAACDTAERALVGVKVGLACPGPLEDLVPYAEALAALGVGELVVVPVDGVGDPRQRLDALGAVARRLTA